MNKRMIVGAVVGIVAVIGWVHDAMLVNSVMKGQIPSPGGPPSFVSQFGIWVALEVFSVIMFFWGWGWARK